jgi:hypothetical protein
MEKQRAYKALTLMIMQLQYWLELFGFVLGDARFAV